MVGGSNNAIGVERWSICGGDHLEIFLGIYMGAVIFSNLLWPTTSKDRPLPYLDHFIEVSHSFSLYIYLYMSGHVW